MQLQREDLNLVLESNLTEKDHMHRRTIKVLGTGAHTVLILFDCNLQWTFKSSRDEILQRLVLIDFLVIECSEYSFDCLDALIYVQFCVCM